MYLIDITIHESAATGDNSAQLLDEHRAWFGKYVDQGNFLLLGHIPARPTLGSLLRKPKAVSRLIAYWQKTCTIQIRLCIP